MSDLLRHDVVVVGAGPAGLAAAWAAASRGKRVALLDDNLAAGGQIWHANSEESLPPPAKRWLAKLRKTSCEIFTRTAVVARPSPDKLLAETADGALRFGFDKLVLATGSRELFLPFPGWTLPGVYGLGGLQSLVKSGLSVAGKHIIVAGTGPLLLPAAAFLRQRGAEILCIVEQAPPARIFRFGFRLLSHPSMLATGLALRARLVHVPYDTGWFPVRAEGDGKVTSVTLTNDLRERTYDCDMLACGFGFVPNIELSLLLGCELDRGFVRITDKMETSVPNIFCAGDAAGIGGAEAAIVRGLIAGAAAAGATPAPHLLFSNRRWRRFERRLARIFALRREIHNETGEDTPVCRCEDVTLRNLRRYDSWREAKLQTRIGMGSCQGRICGPACQHLFGWRNDSIRPPVLPARVDTLIEARKKNP